MKRLIIKTLGLKGSWKWAKRQMRKGRYVMIKDTRVYFRKGYNGIETTADGWENKWYDIDSSREVRHRLMWYKKRIDWQLMIRSMNKRQTQIDNLINNSIT